MKGFSVIWNSIIDPSPLIDEIGKRCIIEQCVSVSFNNSRELYKFVLEIYRFEKKNKHKIIHKAELLKELSNKCITILILEFENCDMTFHGGKGRMVNIQMDELKQDIRNIGRNQLGDAYWFDNVFHISENEPEFNAALSACCNKLSSDYIDKLNCWKYLKSNQYMYDFVSKEPQIIYVSPRFFLFHNLRNADNFNQGNVLIKYHAIKGFYGVDSAESWSLYDEMMHARVKSCQFVDDSYYDHKEKFIELIRSFEKNGFLKNHPILVNEDFELLDGTHRLACALYFGIKQIPVVINSESVYGIAEFRMDWFTNMGLDRHIQIINEELRSISDNM